MMKKTEKYTFKKGDHLMLDQIYLVQGLCGGDWWDHVPDTSLDEITVVRSITIEINWWE